ncbi:hypothetical protein Tsubulata_032428 [Turnera subulata]|uniref:F-box domain-containing protein n=1 Tax=Turnera subulata TaxID=218843 RepID=A0A9Q0F2H8_9ROSI|nr:hypothetical protein Tsubulata_032428 [Turnera subulata]
MEEVRTELVPDENCLDILSKLPAKSVVRFMCLNKSWHNLILDNRPYLADLHYSHHKSSYATDCNYLVERVIKPVLPSLLEAEDDDNNDEEAVNHEGKSAQERSSITDEGYECKSSIGFGFCQVNKDFKVVYVVILYDPGTNEMAYQGVDVYSLASDSWKSLIDIVTVPLDAYDLPPHITFDGNPHWMVQKQKGDPIFIISFDFCTEQFRTISKVQLPGLGGYEYDLGGMEGMELCTYKDMVCIYRRRDRGGVRVFDCELWVLKVCDGRNNYSVDESYWAEASFLAGSGDITEVQASEACPGSDLRPIDGVCITYDYIYKGRAASARESSSSTKEEKNDQGTDGKKE